MKKKQKGKDQERSALQKSQETKIPTPEEINKLMPKKWKELTDYTKEMDKFIKKVKDCKEVLKMEGLNPVVKNVIEFLYEFNVLSPVPKHADFFRDKMMPEVMQNKADNIEMLRKDKFNEVYREEFEKRIEIEASQLKKLPHDKIPKADEESKLSQATTEIQETEKDPEQHNESEELGKPDKQET